MTTPAELKIIFMKEGVKKKTTFAYVSRPHNYEKPVFENVFVPRVVIFSFVFVLSVQLHTSKI